MTHTYAILPVSPDTYAEIRGKLDSAGYSSQFHDKNDDAEVIDMHGIALRATATPPQFSPEDVARMFHETYERLAPSFGYETRKASAKPWDEVPENNRKLMIAVAGAVLEGIGK